MVSDSDDDDIMTTEELINLIAGSEKEENSMMRGLVQLKTGNQCNADIIIY